MVRSPKENWNRYFTPQKVIRDLAHGYVGLTEFELEIIDKAPFQRLKDIRQLTCQQVYPAARHSRFEHSLGVMELTRRAINSLNQNGIIASRGRSLSSKPPISDFVRFNATLAALLHDVGHCPFSHLGETQFDSLEVWHRLREDVHSLLCGSELDRRFQEKKYDDKSDKGAIHEHLSCIVVLEHFYDMLKAVSIENDKNEDKIQVDFELLLRCILGIEYDVKTSTLLKDNMDKNAAIRLINSTIFDMDKLDYIIRDSLFTGIGTPTIDTDRLFRNMHLSEQYSLVFTSKAVPVLQNMIEARDNLYMYVYNHHTAVFSDFMFSYIQRRMDHNARAFYKMLYPSLLPAEFNFIQAQLADSPTSRQGLVLKPYLFSSDAVVDGNRSDSDWLSLVNVIYIVSIQNQETDLICMELKSAIEEERADLITFQGRKQRGKFFNLPAEHETGGKRKQELHERFVPWCDPSEKQCRGLAKQIKRTYSLVANYQARQFLKPWWKTIFEFQNFMDRNFYDDNICKQLCDFIYKGGQHGLFAPEFRSQLAKHVKYITQQLYIAGVLCTFLDDDDFFVVERSVRFFDLNTIEKLDIALRTNEIVGVPAEVVNKKSMQEYYIKNLTSIIPQKDYSSLYGERSFYIYSHDPSCDMVEKGYTAEQVQKFNRTVEQIFVFTAEELIRRGEQDFVERFVQNNSEAEEESMEDIFKQYCYKFPLSPMTKSANKKSRKCLQKLKRNKGIKRSTKKRPLLKRRPKSSMFGR